MRVTAVGNCESGAGVEESLLTYSYYTLLTHIEITAAGGGPPQFKDKIFSLVFEKRATSISILQMSKFQDKREREGEFNVCPL